MERKGFPRGDATEDHEDNRNQNNLHWLPHQKRKKKSKRSRSDSESDPDADYELEERLQKEAETKVVIHDLSYSNIRPKMKLLGRVAEIYDNFVEVYLPGGLMGTIPIYNIIEMFGSIDRGTTNRYANVPALTDLFKVDQLVITEVSNVVKEAKSKEGKATAVYLTVNPTNIYQGWSHTSVAQIGFILQGYVRGVEDHGYILDCGIKDLHAFVNKKECERYCQRWNNGNPLVKGQIVCGVVIMAKSANVRSQIELSLEPGKVSQAQKKTPDYVEDASQLLPGMRYNLEVTKKLRNGFSVIFDEYEGFLVERNVPHKLKDCDIGDSFLGCLLYVAKPLNVAMFSVIPSVVDSIVAPVKEFQYGDIVKSAVVVSESYNGVGLLLNKKTGTRGRIPPYYKRNAEKESNSREILRVGSTVTCRILNFDSLSETYLCTTLQSALKERFFSVKDVPVGLTVTATVKGVTEKHLNVMVGAVSGYIQWYHTADVPLKNCTDKYTVGQKIKGRVLNHIGGKLDITVKESLVKKDCPVLKSYDKAIPGNSYLGTVVGTKSGGLIVSFFGGVKGFLPFSNTDESFKNCFCNVGRSVKCSVIEINGEELLLSLENSTAKVTPGLKCSPVVSSIDMKNRTLQVVCGDSIFGAIPVYHLHDNQKLADEIFHTYSIGDKVEDARCFISAPVVVFSTRGSVRRFFDSAVGEALLNGGSSALQPGNIIPCFIKSIGSDVTLSTPLIDSNFVHRIRRENLALKDPEVGDYLPLVVKDAVKRIFDENVSDAIQDKVQMSVDFLADILRGNESLQVHAVTSATPLSTFSVGNNVRGPVENADHGYKVCLPNGVKGHVNSFCTDENPTVGEIVDGKVIYVDYERLELILSLQESVCSTLQVKSSDVKEGTVLSGRIVRWFNGFYLALVEVNDTLRRAFIPKLVYPSSNAPMTATKSMVGKKLEFLVVQKHGDSLLCVPTKMVKKLVKIVDSDDKEANTGNSDGQKKKKRKRRKRKISSSSVELEEAKVTEDESVEVVPQKNRKNKNKKRSVEAVNSEDSQNGTIDTSSREELEEAEVKEDEPMEVVPLKSRKYRNKRPVEDSLTGRFSNSDDSLNGTVGEVETVANETSPQNSKVMKSPDTDRILQIDRKFIRKKYQKRGIIQKMGVMKQSKKNDVSANVNLQKKLKIGNVFSSIRDNITGKGPRSPLVISSPGSKKALDKAKLVAKYKNIFKSGSKPVKRLK